MQIIEFDEGYRTYQIGNDTDRVIKIRLDPDLMTRIRDVENRISELEERIKNTSPEDLTELSNEVKSIFNDTVGADISTPAFNGANVFTPVQSGKMLFQSFFEAFIPVLEADIKALKPTGPRPEVTKYLKHSETHRESIPDISELTPEEKKALLEKLIS